jgi:glutamyl-tRNA synthetase
MIVRTRFAPSPTGSLHLGSIRTALFCWLCSRNRSGEFILRIEDTDQQRSTQEATQLILDSMSWLGLDYDAGPFYQAQRLGHYRKAAEHLIEVGLAYRCYCSKEKLDAQRERQFANKEKPRYDGHCRKQNLPENKEQPFVIRFKNPQEGSVEFEDQILGSLSFQNSELDDLIIIRTDGFPTYNFCVVVDDLDMKITHVIRGFDHINNTPRQINIFLAFNAKPPIYAHVPTILGNDGKKLSKRHGAASVLQYRDEGFLPEAVLNYLVRLGWSYGDQEIFSRDEMIKLFDIKDINKAAAAFNPEKLLWLNRHYIKTLDPQRVASHLMLQMHELKIDYSKGPKLSEIVIALRERAETLREMAVKSRYFYEDFTDYQEDAKKHFTPEAATFLQAAHHRLDVLNAWTDANLHQVIEDIAKQFELKLGKVAQPIRIAVTGAVVSPPLNITLRLLGKQLALRRIDKALSYIADNRLK